MAWNPFVSKVNIEQIKVDPNMAPARDERFMERAEACLSGSDSAYFAAIPLSLCLPFDVNYHPDLHPITKQAINEALSRVQAGGQPAMMLTYQRGYWFVISDDYVPYFAAIRGMPDYAPCIVLGKPNHPLVRDVQGPLDISDLRRRFGFG